MGIQHLGAFGGFRNKTGALVGHRTGGQNVITAIPHPSNKPPSVAQINQRAKFGMLVSFLRRMTSLIRVGFQDAREQKQSAFSAAITENYYKAITGVAPNFTIDYAKLVYSKGLLSIPYNPTVVIDTPATVKVSWLAYFEADSGSATDMATIVLYNPTKGKFVKLTGASARSTLTFNLPVPADFAGDECHVWISMVSANGKLVSDSQYIGEFTIL